MTNKSTTRRLFITATSAGVISGFAGCSGSEGGPGPEQSNGGTSPESTPENSGGDSSEITEYLDGVGNFDGSINEYTDQDSVTVEVGVEANGGNFGFGPPAIRISSGRTVVWEWTGKGSGHDVVAEDKSYQSELVSDAGHTFEHTFEAEGLTKYYCTPHKTLGMRGAVVVE